MENVRLSWAVCAHIISLESWCRAHFELLAPVSSLSNIISMSPHESSLDHYPAMKPFGLHCMVARTLGDGMRRMGGFDVQSCKSFYTPSSQLTLEAEAGC